VSELDDLRSVAEIQPVVKQVQFSPFEYRRKLLEACEQRNVALEAYSPLGAGRHLSSEGNARSFDFTLSGEDMAALDALDETGGTERG
jgi:diketogulonate reductase-like aldo/keto reductase